MTDRVPATDSSVSWRHHGFSYYTLLPAGREYAQLLREINTPDQSAPPESAGEGLSDNRIRGDSSVESAPSVERSRDLLLDVNELVDESGYVELGLTRISPDDRLLAWSVDRTGDEVYELHFRDLATGSDLEDFIPRSYYGGAWSADSSTFFYTVHDDAYRPFQVWRHAIGTDAGEDVLVLEDTDEQFEVNVRATRSGDLVVIWSENRDTSEVWVFDADEPGSPPRSVGGRRRGHPVPRRACRAPRRERHVAARHQRRGDRVPARALPGPPRRHRQDSTSWSEVRPEDPAERLEQVDAFAGHVVLSFRAEGAPRLRILSADDLAGEGLVVTSQFTPGSITLTTNAEFTTDRDHRRGGVLRRATCRTRTSRSVDGSRHLARSAGRRPATTRRATSRETRTFAAADGTPGPRHRRTAPARRRWTARRPCLLYGYGAYEADRSSPEWDPALPRAARPRCRLRARPHPRRRRGRVGAGGSTGTCEHKQHTFDDHVAVADGSGADGLVDGAADRRLAG